jgi:hypothetical protein
LHDSVFDHFAVADCQIVDSAFEVHEEVEDAGELEWLDVAVVAAFGDGEGSVVVELNGAGSFMLVNNDLVVWCAWDGLVGTTKDIFELPLSTAL